MREFLSRRRDFLAGGLMMLLGLTAATAGAGYNIGTLQRMGPGFFPLALGVILTLLGVLIAGAGAAVGAEAEDSLPAEAQWRGWSCVIAGPLLFVLFAHYGGLLPATFACVFVSALGDRTARLRSSLVLAAGVTLLGAILFHLLLGVPLPLWSWGPS